MSKDNSLTEQMFSSANVSLAIQQVLANKGASGIDRMTTEEGAQYVRSPIDEIENRSKSVNTSPCL